MRATPGPRRDSREPVVLNRSSEVCGICPDGAVARAVPTGYQLPARWHRVIHAERLDWQLFRDGCPRRGVGGVILEKRAQLVEGSARKRPASTSAHRSRLV